MLLDPRVSRPEFTVPRLPIKWLRTSNGLILRYLLTGALNTIFGIAGYSLLIYVGFVPQLAQLTWRLFGIAFCFITYRKWVFRSGRFSVRRYTLWYFANYLIALSVLTISVWLIGNAYLAGLFTITLASVINFLGLRYFVASVGGSNANNPAGGMDAAYRPHPIDWRFLPEWCLFLKDAGLDLGGAVVRPLLGLAPVRALWQALVGQDIERVVAKAGALLIHIPKNGGTSISKQLYGRFMPHLTAAMWRERFGDKLAAYPSFAVMRHPVDRFLSAYRFTLQGGTDLMLASRFERWRLSPMEPLDAFLEALRTDPGLMRIAVQFGPQIDFLVDEHGELIVDRLFAFTSQGQMPAALSDWLGLANIPHINVTKAQDFAISERQREAIARLYQADMELYERVTAAGDWRVSGRMIEPETPGLQLPAPRCVDFPATVGLAEAA